MGDPLRPVEHARGGTSALRCGHQHAPFRSISQAGTSDVRNLHERSTRAARPHRAHEAFDRALTAVAVTQCPPTAGITLSHDVRYRRVDVALLGRATPTCVQARARDGYRTTRPNDELPSHVAAPERQFGTRTT